MPARCSGDLKEAVLARYDDSRGLLEQQEFCDLVRVTVRRLQRWNRRRYCLDDRQAGYRPGTAPHRLLPGEKRAILELARTQEFVDLSHRVLAYTAMDRGEVCASPASFYRVMNAEGLTAHRGSSCGHTGHGNAPEREELTGPLQRLCWDISYLRMTVKWVYLYLYVLLDEWSRKVLGWLVSNRLSRDIVVDFMNEVFLREGILDMPEELRPVIINDRGGQMKAKPVKLMFQDMGIDQRFSRPRTPNDNPFVESFFRTAKHHPEYPGRFIGQEDAESYFKGFFDWYNTCHLHSGIGFVTPVDKHSGRAVDILRRRKEAQLKARQIRLEANREIVMCQKNTGFSLDLPDQTLQCVAST